MIWKTTISFIAVIATCILSISNLNAQELTGNSCTSNDLSVVGAQLTNLQPCFTCDSGTNLKPTLSISVDNKTNSKRTSFAFWGTLKAFDKNGVLVSEEEISGCGGPLPGKTISTLDFNEIDYKCGTTLKITDLLIAWTSASPNEVCPLNRNDIKPKCGTAQSIDVTPPLFALVLEKENEACNGSKDGSIDINVEGGKTPYTYNWGDLSGTNNIEDRTNLAPGTYSVTVTDAEGCSTSVNGIEIEEKEIVQSPIISNVIQPNCNIETGSIAVNSLSEFQYSINDGPYQSSGVFDELEAGSYTITAKSTDGCISAPSETVTIDPQPNTPDAPVVASTTQPSCDNSTGSISITKITGLQYSINGAAFQSDATFSGLTAGQSYNIIAKNADGCISDATRVTINDQPGTPANPTIEVTFQPGCEIKTGSIKVTNPESDLTYSILGPDNYSTSNTSGIFENLQSGSYTVTAKNLDNCTSELSNKVVIEEFKDNEDPEFDSVSNIERFVDQGACSAVVSFAIPTFTDNCEGTTVTQTSDLGPGDTFPVGTTTVSYTATDASGNTDTITFDVIVSDNEDPSISCPADITENVAFGETGAVVTYNDVTFNDNCSATIEQTAGLASGETFPVGTTTNTFVVTDASGNTATCSFTVTVKEDGDTIPPTISCPDDIDQNVDQGVCGATVSFELPTFADNSGDVTIARTDNGPASGDVFPVGTTTVSYTATDAAGNTASCSFTVTVTDNEDPEFDSVSNIERFVDQGACSAVVSFKIPTATDNCEGTTVTQTSDLGPGDTFPVGTTTVSYTATDASGNTDTITFDMIVSDNEDPSISCPTDITENVAFGETGAVVTYNDITFDDNCSATIEQTAGLASGETFPVGTTTNTFVVTDASGNTATCSFTVTIKENGDTTPPTISCPDDINKNVDAGVCGAVVEFTLPSFSDNSGKVTIERTDNGPASGDVFPVGTTTVSYTATDAAGNTASCSFTVAVTDNEDPEFDSVSNIERFVDQGACSAVVSFEIPTATDNCDGTTVTQTSDLGPGDTFPVGTTTVSYTATDASGNTDTITFDVIVSDNEDPTISCPTDITENVAFGETGTVITYNEVTFDDNCSATIEQTAGLASGETFPVGTTTNTFVVTDASGNTATCSFDVTIKENGDTTPPTISCPDDINKNVDQGVCGAVVAFEIPTFADNSGKVTIERTDNGPASGDVFPVGTTTVSYTATDAAGNTASCSFTVTVTDNEDPEFAEVSNITQNTDAGACSAVVSFEIPTATDNCEGITITQTSDLGPGDIFPVGTTTVSYTATDASGNTDTITFDVIVSDNEDPSITCPADITENVAFGETGAVVTYNDITFDDNCSATIEQTAGLASGETFPVGTTTNTFVVTDASGNTATCSFDVTIKEDGDTIPPTITCPDDINKNVDAGVCGAVVEFTLPSFSDNSGKVTIERTDNGPASGDVFPVGTTTVSYTATDAAGNTANCSFTVTVTDNEDPEFAEVSNITQNTDANACSAVVSFAIPTVTDNCEGTTVTQTSDLGPGDTFPVGTTTVSYTATDASGNTDTITFDVIVSDNEDPSISCPADITTTNVIGQDYAIVTYNEVTATDNCEVTVERTSGFASGEQFPVGVTTVTYVATDVNGNSVECSFTVTIKGSPIAVDDSANTDEDTAVEIAVLSNDSDPDNDPLSVTETTTPENGTVVINENGTITYTPNENFNGTDSFEYTITDGNGGFDSAVVTVTVGGINDAPVAVDDSANTDEDTAVEIAVLSNDSDPDNDPLSVTETTTPENGTVVINENGTITYTPNENFNGTDSFEYTITDGNGGFDSAVVTVTVGGVNDAPVAVDDSANTDQDVPVTIAVLDNDSDIDGDELIITETTIPANGTVEINEDGTITYSPNDSFTGEDTFEYTISDGNGGTDTAVVTIIVSDTEGPSIACPETMNLNNDPGICGAIVEFTIPGVSDNSDSAIIEQTGGLDSGSIFPVGTTTITFTATDAAGNFTTCSFDIIVKDNEAPVVEEMDNITVNNDNGICGAVVNFNTVEATDNCEVDSVVITEGLESGSEFPVGTTTVTYTVTDINGNVSTESFTVTVVDNEAPEISCPENITVDTETGVSFATVDFENATATDNCEVSVEQTGGPVSGSQFEIGTTTITFTATDAAGNTSECSFTITVEDNEDPTITCPSDISQNNDPGVCGAVVEFTIPAFDDSSGFATIEQTDGLEPGAIFPVGTTTVTYIVTDEAGNSASCSFDVTVIDSEDPVVEEMDDITVNNDTGICGAVVNFNTVEATDNCEVDSVVITEGLESGSEFPVGTTTVTYTVTDINGNVTTESFTVTVTDNEAPEITCPTNITVDTETGVSFATVDFENATAADNCEVSVEQTGGPVSGSQFEIGTTTITFTATDSAGNTSECSFTITVEDNEDPTITCPADIDLTNDAGVCGAVVDFTIPEFSDNSGFATIAQTAGLESGDLFPVGITTVSYTVTDEAGNSASCSFDVIIKDSEAPVVEEMDDITVNNDNGICGAVVNFNTVEATDNCEVDSVQITEGLESGSEFPVGTTTVTYTVTDINGNVTTESFTVTVVDNEAPEISCPTNITVDTETGVSFATVDFENATATDNCEVSVEQTGGPVSGSRFEIGTTTITFTATDAAGNTSECSFTITVEDNEDPTITCPADIDLTNDAGVCGAAVEFTIPEFSDNSGFATIEQTAGLESGDLFPVGTTTVSYTVTDEAGNSASCSFDVTVIDSEAPVVEEMDDITVNNDNGICGAVVNFNTVEATDNCEIETIEVTEGLVSGSVYPIGTTTVIITVTDVSGNSSTTSFDVTVTDTQAPEIICPTDMTVDTETGVSYATVDFEDATATDNCEVSVEQTGGPVSGSQFEIGTTTITFTATDTAGNTSECSFTITVEDNEDPTITCPSDISQNNDPGVCGAVVEFTIPAFDDSSGFATIEQTDGLEPGAIFPVGTTTVTYIVTDEAGNSASCSFDVTVVDSEAPVVEEMDDITVNNDNGICGAVVNFNTVEATDNCEVDSVQITEGLESGSEFPVGTTTVTYTVTDINGNVTTESFTVTVVDNEAPEISCPENITVDTETGVSFATVDFENATATDNCEVSVEQTGGPVSGSQFEIGITTITFTATDAAGNTSECSFTVTVEDNEDPTISCPSDISGNVDAGICGAAVNFETPAGMDNSGNVTVEQTAGLTSGEVFSVGTTTITFTATDAAGNSVTCSFDIIVTDDEAPVIEEMENIVMNTDNGICGAVVDFIAPSATDNCEVDNVTLTEGIEPGTVYPVGVTNVTYTATDNNGNTASTSFTVTVIDNEAPAIECPENVTETVENGVTSVVVNYEAVTTIDNCEGTTVELTSGIASGEEFPVGETEVTYTVTDASGNSTTCSFTVTVEEEPAPAPPPAPEAPEVDVTQATCAVPTGTITVTVINGLTYSIDGENYQADGIFDNLTPGTYDIVAQDESGQISEFTTVEINDPVAEEIDLVNNGEIDLCTEDSTFDLFELFAGDYDDTGVWVDTNNTGALDNGFIDPSMLAVGSYTFEYQIDGNCPSTTQVSVLINDDCIVLNCSIEDLKDSISNAVTPNGDNINDFFEVDLDTECGFTYDLKIFNRWGAKVFDAQNYQNNWDGYSDSSFTSSNQLPSGTYFYVLEIRNSDFEPIQGYIYLGTK